MTRKTFEFGTAALVAPQVEWETARILSEIPAMTDPEVAALDAYWARELALYRQHGKRGEYETFLPGRAYTYKRLGHILAAVFPGSGQQLLDVGCGSAILSRYVAERVRRYTALDVSRAALEFARELALGGHVKLNLVEGSAFEMPLKDASVDISVSLGLLEHFNQPDQASILSEMSRVSRIGNIVVVPNTTCAIYHAMSALEAIQSGPAYSFPLEEHYFDVDFAGLSLRAGLSTEFEGAFHLAPPAEIPGEFLSDGERAMFVELRDAALALYKGDAMEAWWSAEDSIDVGTRNVYGWFKFAVFV